jgi:hypothetical protein
MAEPTTFEDFYNQNPISIIDQNVWIDQVPDVIMNFQKGPTIYTPLIDWMDRSKVTGAEHSQFTELLEGDVDNDEISITAQYIAHPAGVDSRMRQVTTKRYGDKVQVTDADSVFQMWKMSGGRDWRGLLRGVLGNNVRRKLEKLARNAYLGGPTSYWTFGGSASDFSEINSSAIFQLGAVNAWNLRLGSIGEPVIPGDIANAKLCMVPPGVIYDFIDSLVGPEKTLWVNSKMYANPLPYEIGMWKNIRFLEVPNDKYGENMAVLYNAGPVIIQATVAAAITAGDGCPDPETTAVDDTWYVGQKDVTHYIQLTSGTDMDAFELNDQVSLHTLKSNGARVGVNGGVDILSGKTIVRRVVVIDKVNYRIGFDRPVMKTYETELATDVYAYVTKAAHVAFNLVLGSRGGIMGNVNRQLKFYEPRPIDDFESVYRYVWDIIAGYNIWEPSLFECHFTAVSLPKPGGIISPPDPIYS